MKKIVALFLAGMMLFALAACGGSSGSSGDGSDLKYIKEKGVLVVGITDFEPMDYKDGDGSWIGFDADMATAFAQSLGVSVEFV